MSVDPLQAKYPNFSSYNFTLNSPISLIDPNGLYVIRNVKKYDKDGKLIPKHKFWIKAKTIEIHITIHNAKVYNASTIPASPDAMANASNNIKSEIETNLTKTQVNNKGQTISTKVEFSGSIEIVNDLDKIISKGDKKDFLIIIANHNIIKEFAKGDANGAAVTSEEMMVINPYAGYLLNNSKSKGTATHEMGHTLGLSHNEDMKSVMYRQNGEDFPRGEGLLADESKKLSKSGLGHDFSASLKNIKGILKKGS